MIKHGSINLKKYWKFGFNSLEMFPQYFSYLH